MNEALGGREPLRQMQQNPEMEHIPAISFEDYRQLCDAQVDNFRHVGVLDRDEYDAALNDDRTLFCAQGDKALPLATPIEYESGYDAERCKKLTGHRNVYLLSLPLDFINEKLFDGGITSRSKEGLDDAAFIVEQPATFAEDHQAFAKRLAVLGNLEPRYFNDPRIRDESQRAASMSIFDFSLVPTESMVAQRTPVRSINEAWIAYKQEHQVPESPSVDSEATYLFSGTDLRNTPELTESLWQISEVGFGSMLGEYHPVSMEETRDFFEQHLYAPGAYTAVRYHKGKPVCFGSITTDLNECEWLNLDSKKMQQVLSECAEQNESPILFSEVISNSDRGARYSPAVFRLLNDMVGRVQKPYRIFFESTNLSAGYIPYMSARSVEASDAVNLSAPIKEFDRLSYWYLENTGTSAEQ